MPKVCRNCNNPIDTPFCPLCGQSAKVEVPTIKVFINDAIGAIFSYDAKVWRTIGKLLTKPGQLSDDYVNGKRISLMAPVTLYFWLQTLSFLSLKYFNPKLASTADDRARSILVMTVILAIAAGILNAYKKRRFAEHVVFSLHLNSCLLFLLMIEYAVVPGLVALLGRIGWLPSTMDAGPIITQVAVYYLIPYTILAMRRFYGDGYPLAIAKTMCIYFFYFYVYGFVLKVYKLH